jgi:hypothetical protein
MDIVTMAAPILPVAMVTAVTESLVTNVAAAAKRSAPVISVVTVSAATGSLVTNVAATAKLFVNANS